MKMMKAIACAAVVGVTALMLGGCASYYQVKDPMSGSVYYTQEYDEIKGGAVKFKDAKGGSIITIQNSEVLEIDSQAFEQGLKAPAPSKQAAQPTIIIQQPVAAPAAEPAKKAEPAKETTTEPAKKAEPAKDAAPAAAPEK